MEKKTTLVHRYKNHISWRGKKYAYNRDGCALLTSDIVHAGFNGVRFNDHRKRKKVFLMSREAM